jgi:putative ABC transport system permease protein
MLKSYFKTAIRSLVKSKAFSVINITGLAMSMSVCLLIIHIIAEQKSYDQFHVNKNRIYRIMTIGKGSNDFRTASSAFPLAAKLKLEYPAVEQSASLVRNIGGDMLYNEKAASGGGYFADGQLFKVLDFELSKGDRATALQNPFSLVVSEEIAQQLFGREDPIGKAVRFNDRGINPGGPEKGNRETFYGLFTITGILKSAPGKTHLPFALLASISTLPALAVEKKLGFDANDWDNVWTNYTYVLLKENKTKEDLQTALDQVSLLQFPKGSPNEYQFKANALTAITPSDPIGNETNMSLPSTFLLIMGILAMIVMLSAYLNYTNLSIARYLTRTKEVGIRKVAGATRTQIFFQFISEAITVALLSLLLAIGLLKLLQFALTGMWLNQFIQFSFQDSLPLFLVFILFSIVIGFIAGLLPSMYISAFNPIAIMKNLGGIKLMKRLTLRKALLVVQFTVSLIFIISTSVLYQQTNHLLHFDYGFDKDNIVNVNLYKPENYQRFAQAVALNKDIAGISACSFAPSTGTQHGTRVYKADKPADSLEINFLDIDSKFTDVWGLGLVAGKTFPEIPDTSGERYVLVNETLVKQYNYASPTGALGQKLLLEGSIVEIIGVVNDFQFLDVGSRIKPLTLRNRPGTFGVANIKVRGTRMAETIAFIEKTWKSVNPDTKFEYQFLDQQLLFTYSMLTDIAKILGFLSLLAVLISSLGLLGMAAYMAEARSKEISIRKIVGSGVPAIVVLLTKGFVKLLLIATVIAIPAAYFLNTKWLQFFASRVTVSPAILLLSVAILFVVSMLIVFSQSWRAAFANPVKKLRNE